ncbi:3' exoribonuclease [Micromonas pusilla CCMP1545]|uniref:Ribosomal RNA-processing protein 43 n=1 Tax=Micromonas pusilla (strain CCMP1545) TaxID=564608 RepID=C1N3D3_MICPC|nr:3' exoribonuclease [Micromonas pusilla CCMP1545]EEH53177.1 3' exoribonuclease [Micromonas pusilla CCMP1545]|eukprot:XP_003062358.1 3' exoribonuclease [Micromonas pusilla CCMP1545]
MEAAAYKRLYPHEYYRKFLAEETRPDGRPLARARDVSVANGVVTSADGSALVKIGRTTALAAAKLEPAPPEPTAPDVGVVEVTVELPPMCAASARPGRPTEESQRCARRIEDVLRDANVVDLRKLCIKRGVYAWRVCVDVYVLDHDGGILDAALCAVVGALKDAKVPRVDVDDRGKLVWGGGERERRPGDADADADANGDGDASTSAAACVVDVASHPLSLTIGQYDGKLVVDPNFEEEALMESVVSVVMREDGDLVCVSKPGGTREASESTLIKCIAAARLRYPGCKKAFDDAFDAVEVS